MRTSLWRLDKIQFALALGDKDAAFRYFDDAVARRSSDIRLIKVEPLLDPMRDDPRFAALLAKVKL